MSRTLHSPENQQLVLWLKRNREKQGLSMRDLATKMDVSHTFIIKVEQQERRLDVVEYVHYCKALDISPIDGIKLVEKHLI